MEDKNELNQPQDGRRDFIKRYGKYAAAVPVVTLMASAPKTAVASCAQYAGKSGNCHPTKG